MIGKTITHFKILEKLGGGGMGVVYKAQDLNLERFVALKFLPPDLGKDEDEKQRFIQEAKAASALDHNNICNVYEIDKTEDGQLFICMACYDGETLKKKIERGPLTIEDSIDIAIQIAEGLHKAHQKEIVHRDIKPANVMITMDGIAKVVDFGIAKLSGQAKLTKKSTTLGTVAYMSPEQVQGEAVDQRSDIWSLGVVLYEMLTAKLPFQGEYDASLMYAILNDEAEAVQNYRSDVSSELGHILSRVLEKDPEHRYQSMHDLLIELKRIKRDSSKVSRKSLKEIPVTGVLTETKEVTKKKTERRKPTHLIPTAIITILAFIIISFFVLDPFSDPPLPPMKAIPFSNLPGFESNPSFSPDGTQMAFSWAGLNGANDDIYVKLIGVGTQDLDRITEHPGEDSKPKWSPDGRYIAFIRSYRGESSIYSLPARGGTERKLTSFGPGRGLLDLSWSPDSKSIAFSATDSTKKFLRIFLLSVENHQVQPLTDGPDLGLNDAYCAISPDGSRLAFVRGIDANSNDIYLVSIMEGDEERLTFIKAQISGLCWTTDGSELVFSSNHVGDLGDLPDLWRISADGGEPRNMTIRGSNPVIANQGNLLAFGQAKVESNIWHVEIPQSEGQNIVPKKLIYSTQPETEAKFSSEGKKIVYLSMVSGSNQIWICDSDGKNHKQITKLIAGSSPGSPHWSPDGRMITFDQHLEGQTDIFTIDVDGGSPFQLTKNPTHDHSPRYSRDGKWIYFNSNRTGIFQIWKISAQGGAAVQVTRNGGYIAYESQDRKWVYFTKEDTSGIWRIAVDGDSESLVINRWIGWNNWCMGQNGIYYLKTNEYGNFSIDFYNFKTKNITEIAELEKRWITNLSASPDQHWILYEQFDQDDQNIILVENFR